MKQLQKNLGYITCKSCAKFCSKRINIKKQVNRECYDKNTNDFNKERIKLLEEKVKLLEKSL